MHGCHGCVWRVIGADFGAEILRRMKDGDPKYKSHEEATNVGEVVKAWEQSDNEANDDVEEKEKELFAG